jgi:hypothetical protein
MLTPFASILPVCLKLCSGIRGDDVRLLKGARRFGLRYALSIAFPLLVGANQSNALAGLGDPINQARDFLSSSPA